MDHSERPDPAQIPDLYLEMLAAGELDEQKKNELEAKYGADEVRRRVEALKESNAAILARYPAEKMAAQIAARAENRSAPVEVERKVGVPTTARAQTSYRRRLNEFGRRIITDGLAVRYTAGFAAAGLVLVFGIFLVVHMERVSPDSGVRAKGIRPTVLIYKHAGNEAELLQNGDIVKAGDTLQLSYVSAGKKFGVILSIDGRGTITVHLPETSGGTASRQAAALESHGQTALPFAYQLDNAPRFERFFFVTSDRPFPVSEATKGAEQLAVSGKAETVPELPLPSGLDQVSVLLRKPGD
ncbi:MAG TPA: hypothetical protein VMW87_10070 [Spirochaetia bacterium]|nr:hypothetical protein [Spirochaetia bacterium]